MASKYRFFTHSYSIGLISALGAVSPPFPAFQSIGRLLTNELVYTNLYITKLYGNDYTEENMFITLKNATKKYGEGESLVYALNHTNLEIEKGEICVILGPSGSGKSTLLNMLGDWIT